MADVFIYALCAPGTGEVRYVGKTTSPHIRLRQHLLDRQNPGKRQWIEGLLAQGLRPDMLILERVTDDSWPQVELQWIEFHRKQGANLLNVIEHRAGLPPRSRRKPQKHTLSLPHLRAWRHANKLTLEMLAEVSGVSFQTIWRAEVGYEMSLITIQRLAAFFGVTPTVLVHQAPGSVPLERQEVGA